MGQQRPGNKSTFVRLGDVRAENLFDADGLFRVYRVVYKATPPLKIVKDHLEKAAAAALVLFFREGSPEHPLLFVSQQHNEAYSISDAEFDSLVSELQELQKGGADALKLEDYALEKLQAEYAPASQKAPYKNNGLFSEHFLATRLKDSEDWHQDAELVRRRLLDLYEAKEELLASAKEAQTEEEFIKPVLKLLGFAYSVQPKTTGSGGAEHPDYVLFASEADKTSAVSGGGEDKLFGSALAIGEAKYWDRDLDKKRRGDPREVAASAVSPSFQIARYLEATGVEWGILTNGREWRLYWGRAADKQKRFYAVDLLQVLHDPKAFKYFYLFFRKEAYQDGAKPSFLRRAIEESEKYGLRVGKKLKDVVFEEAFPSLANGFLAYHREKYELVDEGVLRETYRASLTLLYRLLFLLYAEDRELLPVDDALGYQKYSLSAIRRDIAERLDRGERFSKNSYDIWEKLMTLFKVIDKGDQALRVPPYNGGLFRQERYPYLDSHRVADYYLVQALDKLARQEDEDGVRRFVDYKYLTVRELGAVYEGLLEYRLVEDGDAAYLENSEGERHLTGSYYTPDYVVQYIVENVLAPLVSERKEAVEKVLAEYEKARRAQHKNPSRQGAEDLARLREKALDTLLDVKVVDPAMGSGHFLVAAVDYLSENFASVITELNAEAITDALDEIREEIKQQMRDFGLELKDEQLSDINLLKRMVMKRSVSGVDLNEMAVELAKLSLWLDAFTVGAPLSFLDHHLRHGNSVVGMNKREFLDWVKKENLLWLGEIEKHIADATIKAEALQKIRDLSPADISESQRLYHESESELLPLRHALDIYTTGLYAPKPKRGQPPHPFLEARTYMPALRLEALADPPKKNHIAEAVNFAREHHFFHWEFEFPEVFFPPSGTPRHYNPGFDAVVGNPPYVRQEQLSQNKEFFKKAYADVWAGKADLYTYFFARAFAILREDGRFGYISSRQFVKAEYGEGLRRLLASRRLIKIVDFGENKVFENAATFPAIFIAENAPSQYPVLYTRVSKSAFSEIVAAPGEEKVAKLESFEVERASKIGADAFEPDSWTLATAEENEILRKMREVGVPLANYTDGIYYGIKTGYNKAFFIDEATRSRLISEDPKSEQLIKPLLVGDDVRHYYAKPSGQYIIVIPSSSDFDGPSAKKLEKVVGITPHPWKDAESEDEAVEIFSRTYPAIYRHTLEHKVKLRKRQDQGKWWWELRSCTYYHLFERPKIIYPDIAKEPRFYLDEEGYYLSNTAYFFAVGSAPLLGILNSRLFFWAAQQLLSSLGQAREDGRLRFFKAHLDNLYVPKPNGKHSEYTAKVAADVKSAYTDGQYSEVLKIMTKEPLQARSDIMLDTIGYLAEKLLALNKQRLRIEDEWVDWVRHEYSAEKKLGKNWLLNDWVSDGLSGGVEAILERFKSKRVRLTPVTLRALEQTTRSTLDKLRPVYYQIINTDNLVNRIVYALYGLTEDEISIVEAFG